MKAQIVNLTLGMDGRQQLTLALDEDFRSAYDELKDAPITFEPKRWKRKRSLDANAYCWVLLDKLAYTLHRSKTDIYREYVRNIGGVSDTVCVQDKAVAALRKAWEHNGIGWQSETLPSKVKGCTNVILYYGSSTYDTAQMSRLIDMAVSDCKALGIDTASPRMIESLVARWGEEAR